LVNRIIRSNLLTGDFCGENFAHGRKNKHCRMSIPWPDKNLFSRSVCNE
jgi:hypothetical protein